MIPKTVKGCISTANATRVGNPSSLRTLTSPVQPAAPALGIQRSSSATSVGTVRRMSSGKTSFEETTLPHQSLDPEQHQQLQRILGEKTYAQLAQTRHKEGLCHADTTHQIIKIAKNQRGNAPVPSMAAKLIERTDRLREQGLGILAQPLGVLLNLTVPFSEILKNNAYRYSKKQLLDTGVPKDSVAVVVNAWQGALDPDSKQATTAKSSFDIGELGDANHAFIVLHVDQDKQEVLCCDLDPFRNEKEVFFKVDKKTFEERVLAFSMMAIRKKAEGEA